jgi:hypothetical protein
MTIIRIFATAAGEGFPFDVFLVDCDFDAHGGLGAITFSNSPDKARRFIGIAEALEFYRTVSPRFPVRSDGEPNRPLSAFTVEFINEPGVAKHGTG